MQLTLSKSCGNVYLIHNCLNIPFMLDSKFKTYPEKKMYTFFFNVSFKLTLFIYFTCQPTTVSHPFCPPICSPHPFLMLPIHSCSDSAQKGAGLDWESAKHSISSCIRTTYLPLCSAQVRQSRMRNRFRKVSQSLRYSPFWHCRPNHRTVT